MISYAQNLEDVILNRIFQNKRSGFYIDVGAHDPTDLSVTKHFYDLGWRGINIEPVPLSFEKFKHERPGDINLNLAVGSKHDFAAIYEIEDRPELSTMDKKIADSAAKIVGSRVKAYTVEIRTLAEICEQYCTGFIDFIKIDVEGFEGGVIKSADWEKFRPTMLAVEATKPCEAVIDNWDSPDKAAAWQDWEPILLRVGYILIYYDGLNKFYLRKEDQHLKSRFVIPVTPLQDKFSRYEDVKKVNHFREENLRLQEGFNILRDKLASQESTFLSERDSLKDEGQKLAEEIKCLLDANERSQEQIRKQSAEIAEFQQSLKSFKEANQGLVEKLRIVDAHNATMNKQISILIADQKNKKEQFAVALKVSERLKEEKANIEKKLRKVVGELSILRASVRNQYSTNRFKWISDLLKKLMVV